MGRPRNRTVRSDAPEGAGLGPGGPVRVLMPELVPTSACVPTGWNVNEQTPATFAALVEEIQTVGFLEALILVPIGHLEYRILGGEYRWRAAEHLHLPEVSAIILPVEDFEDEDVQKALSFRLNNIRGKPNPEKLARLLHEFVAKRSAQEVRKLFAVTEDDQWRAMVETTRKALQSHGTPEDALAKYDKQAKQARTTDELAAIVKRLQEDHGSTLQHSYMVLTLGGREHVYIPLSKASKGALDRFLRAVVDKEPPGDVDLAMRAALLHVADHFSKDAPHVLPR